METYFNNLSAIQEKLTIGPPGPEGWNTAILTRTYPVDAPTLSIVLYNPSTPMDFLLRLYAACCEGRRPRLFQSRLAEDGEPHRKLRDDVDVDALLPAPQQPESGAARRPD